MTTTQPQPTNTPTLTNPGVVCTFTRPDRPIDLRDPSVPWFDGSDYNPVMNVQSIGCEYNVHVSSDDPARFVVTVGAFGPIVRDVAERMFVASADVPYPMAFAYVCSVVVAMVADDVAAEMSY